VTEYSRRCIPGLLYAGELSDGGLLDQVDSVSLDLRVLRDQASNVACPKGCRRLVPSLGARWDSTSGTARSRDWHPRRLDVSKRMSAHST